MRFPAGLRAAVTIVVTGGFLTPAGVFAQDLETAVRESYPTNLTMLGETTKAAVSELFLGFTGPRGTTLLVETVGTHEANWFVENHLLSYLTEAGYQAYLREVAEVEETAGTLAALDTLAADTTATADTTMAEADLPPTPEVIEEPEEVMPEEEPRPEYVLRYRVVQFEITYPDNYRASPLGSRKVQRRASVSVMAHLLRGDREDVVWVGTGDVEGLDVVPASKLPLLEGPNFPFNQPTLETRGLGSLVEPVLVTGIVAGLIYLFYTNQN
jgi:hypothetical protein